MILGFIDMYFYLDSYNKNRTRAAHSTVRVQYSTVSVPVLHC